MGWKLGGAIMVLAIWLFDNQLARIVSISFTSLILNELILVAMEINTWHIYMVYAQLFSLCVYGASMLVLKNTFGPFLYAFLRSGMDVSSLSHRSQFCLVIPVFLESWHHYCHKRPSSVHFQTRPSHLEARELHQIGRIIKKHE